MKSATLTDIEKKIESLSAEEQRTLLKNLALRLRQQNVSFSKYLDLAEMAQDSDIQRELKHINEEFASTEEDGL